MTRPPLYRIRHLTRFLYTVPVRRCVMSLCMAPRRGGGRTAPDFEASSSPPGPMSAEADPFGNTRHVLTVYSPHSSLEVSARSTVEAPPSPALPETLGKGAWAELRSSAGAWADWDFVHPSRMTAPSPALEAFAARLEAAPESDPLEDLLRLNTALHEAFEYTPGATLVDSPMEHILETGRGVCQDYAHVMIALARSWGVPARYVSGYLHLTGAEDNPAAAAATHAWVECRLPGLGWAGFDPANCSTADERYIPVAVGRDYSDVPPTRGVLEGGGRTEVEVEVEVTRL